MNLQSKTVKNVVAVALGLVLICTIAIAAGNKDKATDVATTEKNNVTGRTAGVVLSLDELEEQALEAIQNADYTQMQTAFVTAAEEAIASVPDGPVLTEEEQLWQNRLMADVDNQMNVRAEASTGSEIVGRLRKGDVAEVVEIGEEWTHIKSGNVDGFVKNEYCVYGLDALAYAKENIDTRAFVTGSSVRLREEPTTDCGVVTAVSKGMLLIVDTDAETVDGWVPVGYVGKTRYISADYVDDERLLTLSDIDDFLTTTSSFYYFLEKPFEFKYYDTHKKYINLFKENSKFETFLKILETANINNAFPEARYGNLENDYDLDSDLLYEIMHILQFESMQYDKCVLLKNNNYRKRIYPDKNSKIYIIKDNKIERVYTYECIDDYFERIITDEYKDIVPRWQSNLSCTIECGLDNILNKIPEQYKDYYNILSTQIDIDNMNIICFYQDKELKIVYKKFFSDLERDDSDIKDIIDDYENNIKDNCIYDEQRKVLEFLKKKKEEEKTLKKALR